MDCLLFNPEKESWTVIESWSLIFTTPSPAIVFKIGITLKRYKPKAAFGVFSNNYRNPYATTDNLPETQIKRTNVKTMDRYVCQK